MKILPFIVIAALSINSLAFCDDASRNQNAVVAQQDDYPLGISEISPENLLFGELGGNGLSHTINYERLFSKRFGLRVGYGPYFGNPIPLMVNYYVGTKYQLELGIGIVLLRRWKTNPFQTTQGARYFCHPRSVSNSTHHHVEVSSSEFHSLPFSILTKREGD